MGPSPLLKSVEKKVKKVENWEFIEKKRKEIKIEIKTKTRNHPALPENPTFCHLRREIEEGKIKKKKRKMLGTSNWWEYGR